ncbi:MAG: hypothetical protein ABI559_09675 [Chloroflexota bacterium]
MRRTAIILGLAIVGTLLVACSSSDDNSTATVTTKPTATSSPSATTPATSASSATGTTVDVKVQEWSINPTVKTATAGEITFNVKNIGPSQKHEFVVLQTDLTAAQLPKKADGTVDEEGAGITSPGEIADIAVGGSDSKTLTLTPGHYLFICNLIDDNAGTQELHYTEGMHTDFTVQ